MREASNFAAVPEKEQVRTTTAETLETRVTFQRPETSTIDASVIVCAYTEQRWQDLVEAVHSVQHQTVAPLEIIIVIDHNPALLKRVRESISGVQVTANQQERGLSGARNTGIHNALGSVLVFMDEDAVAEPNWLESLYQLYKKENVSGVGGAIHPWWINEKPRWFPEEFNWVVGCTYRGMPESTAPVRNLIGANMSYRREVFDAVGGFTIGMGRVGTLPVGCEETELCIRASQSNQALSFLYEPRAVVRHRVPAARATWRYFFSRCYSEGISKAQVANLVGSQQGLASERSYTLRTLPKGVLMGIRDALRGDKSGLARAAAIISGLGVTSAGYLIGSMKVRRSSQRKAEKVKKD